MQGFYLVSSKTLVEAVLFVHSFLGLGWPDCKLTAIKLHFFIECDFRGDNSCDFVVTHRLIELLA
jgi:hypothetical protein